MKIAHIAPGIYVTLIGTHCLTEPYPFIYFKREAQEVQDVLEMRKNSLISGKDTKSVGISIQKKKNLRKGANALADTYSK
jgi:hypothetical protein